MCLGKVKNTNEFPRSKLYSISAVDTNCIGTEPGLLVSNSVAKLGRNRTMPIMVVNQTNQSIRLAKGCIIAKLEAVDKDSVQNVNSVLKEDNKLDASDWTTDVDVPGEHRDVIVDFLRENSDLFAITDTDHGHTNTVKMKIDTQDQPPIKQRPYRNALKDREVVDKAIDEMIDAKVIRRSNSPWSFPVVIVDKKDGSKRFCVGFRKLNQITKPKSYPRPLIDDILAVLGKAKYFTSLDLKSGYWQVLIDENDTKTAFVCHRGLFELSMMPSGLSNAAAVFPDLRA